MNRRGFTLLEIVIALAILGVSLYVLVDAEATSTWMTQDARQMAVANGLAEKAMAEIQLYIEQYGFDEDSVEDYGSFEEFGEDGTWGEGVSFGGQFDAFSYAYVIRKVELSLGDSTDAISEMAHTSSSGGDDESSTSSAFDNVESSSGDLTSLVSGDALSEMLDPYVREVRVVVWWGNEPEDYETCDNCIQLVTHVVNTSANLSLGSATGSDSSSTTGGTSGAQGSSGSSGALPGGSQSGGGGGASSGQSRGTSGGSSGSVAGSTRR
jgi:prepilin-type N-terminal cleavage/methylation domain-containing protein